tara:strand:+ start:2481 stop:2720 length:240 start_codon:yes stop_codon:yes gene_type:complete
MEDHHIVLSCKKCKSPVVDIWVHDPSTFKKTDISLSCCNETHSVGVVGDFAVGQLEGMVEVQDIEYEEGAVNVIAKRTE